MTLAKIDFKAVEITNQAQTNSLGRTVGAVNLKCTSTDMT